MLIIIRNVKDVLLHLFVGYYKGDTMIKKAIKIIKSIYYFLKPVKCEYCQTYIYFWQDTFYINIGNHNFHLNCFDKMFNKKGAN